jgi:hypothetical protein
MEHPLSTFAAALKQVQVCSPGAVQKAGGQPRIRRPLCAALPSLCSALARWCGARSVLRARSQIRLAGRPWLKGERIGMQHPGTSQEAPELVGTCTDPLTVFRDFFGTDDPLEAAHGTPVSFNPSPASAAPCDSPAFA